MWSIIFKELRFAVLDKTCAKHRPQLCCCLKLAPNHTAQLLFCFKLNGIVEKLRLVQKTVHNCPVAQNWRQNTVRNCCFGWNWRLASKSLKLCKTDRATVNLLKLACQVRNVQTSSNLPFLGKTVSFVKKVKKKTTWQKILTVCLKACACKFT